MKNQRWIDVHTHLNMLEVTGDEALQAARQAGVERLITIGTNPNDFAVVMALAQKYAPQVWCTLGVHPHEAELFDQACEVFLKTNCDHPTVVAVGEIGLDYYYEKSPREAQRSAFRRQLELSVEKGLPVEIHSRDAEPDTIAILKDFGGRVRGLMHCFTGSQWLADASLALGLDISFSGVITFKNADPLRAVVKNTPPERIHVETDAPFLTPVPFRGKKNQPAFVVHTAGLVAELKGLSEDDLAVQLAANARRLFTKLDWPKEVLTR